MITVACVGLVSSDGFRWEPARGQTGYGTAHFNLVTSDTRPLDDAGKRVSIEEFNFNVQIYCRQDDPVLKLLVKGEPLSFAGFLRRYKKLPYIQAIKPLFSLRAMMQLEDMLDDIPSETLSTKKVEEL